MLADRRLLPLALLHALLLGRRKVNADASPAIAWAVLAVATGACAYAPGKDDTANLPAPVAIRNMTNATLAIELRDDETALPVSAAGEVAPCGETVLAFAALPAGDVRVHARADRVKNGPAYGVSWAFDPGIPDKRIDLHPGMFGSYILFDDDAPFDVSNLCTRKTR